MRKFWQVMATWGGRVSFLWLYGPLASFPCSIIWLYFHALIDSMKWTQLVSWKGDMMAGMCKLKRMEWEKYGLIKTPCMKFSEESVETIVLL